MRAVGFYKVFRPHEIFVLANTRLQCSVYSRLRTKVRHSREECLNHPPAKVFSKGQ